MTRNYFGLTELEVELFKTIHGLSDDIKRLNKFLEKANGYGTGDFSYTKYLGTLDELEARMHFTATMISKKEFNELFEFDNNPTINDYYRLIEKKHKRHPMSSIHHHTITNGFSKEFICKVRTSNVVGDCDLVYLGDISFPIGLFKNFKPVTIPEVSANTIYGFFGFENKKI